MTRLSQLLLAAMLACGAAGLRADEPAQPDPAVDAGREALAQQWDLNWYDADTDGFRPVDLPKPRPPRRPSSFGLWLDSLFAGFGLDFAGVMLFLLWLAGAALLLWLVVALIRAYLRAEHASAQTAAHEFDARAHLERVEALPVAVEENIDDYLHAARRAHEAGDLSRAIVYLFSHELLELDRGARLRLVKGKTNRQYLRELRSGGAPAPRLAEILARTVGLFEAAFFGGRPPAPDAFEHCWREARELDQLLAAAEAP